jgi:hypothetical protein
MRTRTRARALASPARSPPSGRRSVIGGVPGAGGRAQRMRALVTTVGVPHPCDVSPRNFQCANLCIYPRNHRPKTSSLPVRGKTPAPRGAAPVPNSGARSVGTGSEEAALLQLERPRLTCRWARRSMGRGAEETYVAAGCGSRSSTAASRRLQTPAEPQSPDLPPLNARLDPNSESQGELRHGPKREFIKRAGVGTVGLGALAASPPALAARPGFPKGTGSSTSRWLR